MYYYKLLKLNEHGELLSPISSDRGNMCVWKVGEWKRTDSDFFYASETIVDALRSVCIQRFSIIALVEFRDHDPRGTKLFTEIIGKEMRVVKAYHWPEYLNEIILKNLSTIKNGYLVRIQLPNYFFGRLSAEEKDQWEEFFTEEMKKFIPYKNEP
jgi:hypothetical protein